MWWGLKEFSVKGVQNPQRQGNFMGFQLGSKRDECKSLCVFEVRYMAAMRPFSKLL